jgi:hypothetical protein
MPHHTLDPLLLWVGMCLHLMHTLQFISSLVGREESEREGGQVDLIPIGEGVDYCCI